MALTKFAKALIGIVGVGAVAGGLYYAGQKGLGGGSNDDVITNF